MAVQTPWPARVKETLACAVVARLSEIAGDDLDPDVGRQSVDDESRPGTTRRHIQILPGAGDLNREAGNSEVHSGQEPVLFSSVP